jgi:hypothetical protein
MVHQALFAKDETAQLVSEFLDLLRIAGCAEAFGQLKECFFFLPGGFDALLDEFHKYAVVAEGALPGYIVDLLCDSWGQGDASADVRCTGSFWLWHRGTIVHHFGASTNAASFAFVELQVNPCVIRIKGEF